MAQVDFSNAVLDVNPNSNMKPMTEQYYLGLEDQSYLGFYDSNGSSITSGASRNDLANTPTKFSELYTGTFTASGTECYIKDGNGNYPWKISNISFSNGDTYSCVIDVDISGNT